MKFCRSLMFLLLLLLTSLFADDGKISSKVYFEYNYQTEEDASDKNGFEVRRAYLTYQNKISETIDLKLTADVGRQKEDSTNTHLFFYLKYAYISWKIDYGQLIFGAQSMNLFSVQEKTWGYRFIEKSAMDKNKFSSSADLGIGYANQFTENIYMSYLITNGGGYKKAETDVYKRHSVLFVYGPGKLNKKNGFNMGAVVSYESYKEDKVENEIIAGLFSGFAVKNFRIGAELNYRKDSAVDEKEYLASVYGSYKITKQYDVFCRIDHFNKEKDENHLIAGFIYTPFKSLNIAPNYRHTWGKDSKQNYNVNFQYKF